MKRRVWVPIQSGEHEIFGHGLEKALVGQTTKKGQKVVNARRISDQEIHICVEMDVPDSEYIKEPQIVIPEETDIPSMLQLWSPGRMGLIRGVTISSSERG